LPIHCSALQFPGAYFHPLTAKDSVDFFKHFGPIRLTESITFTGKFLPSGGAAQPVAKLLDRLTVGTVMSGNDIKVYRQAGSMLTSVDNCWPGVVGGQTFPWMAVADDVPVWTQSGLVQTNWLDKSGISNSHMPYVKQQGNVALIAYKPDKPMPLSLWGDVALYWQEHRFTETRRVDVSTRSGVLRLFNAFTEMMSGGNGQNGSWILGRRNSSYIAVFRPCGDKKQKGWYACSGIMGRQVWASVVGDESRYGSFDAFSEVVQGATVEESYRWRLMGRPLYVTSVAVEATKITLEW
jgi:hypothetical protein